MLLDKRSETHIICLSLPVKELTNPCNFDLLFNYAIRTIKFAEGPNSRKCSSNSRISATENVWAWVTPIILNDTDWIYNRCYLPRVVSCGVHICWIKLSSERTLSYICDIKKCPSPSLWSSFSGHITSSDSTFRSNQQRRRESRVAGNIGGLSNVQGSIRGFESSDPLRGTLHATLARWVFPTVFGLHVLAFSACIASSFTHLSNHSLILQRLPGEWS